MLNTRLWTCCNGIYVNKYKEMIEIFITCRKCVDET